METWTTVGTGDELAGLVTFTEHTRFLATGEQIHDPSPLKLHTETGLRDSLETAANRPSGREKAQNSVPPWPPC